MAQEKGQVSHSPDLFMPGELMHGDINPVQAQRTNSSSRHRQEMPSALQGKCNLCYNHSPWPAGSNPSTGDNGR